jgi:cytoskeletal protein CcmA (bactofilin family)
MLPRALPTNREATVFKRRRPDELPDGTHEPPPPPTEAVLSGGGTGTEPADTGLGVPPFRPAEPAAALHVPHAAQQEAPRMARSPFATPPSPLGGSPTPSPAPTQAGAPPLPRPPAPPQARPTPPATREPAPERRTLVVGRGISVQGTVQDAERLVVEGIVEAGMIHATELAISPGGIFRGEVQVEDAEIAGTIDGTVTARGNLVVRATGIVIGTARCRRLQVEDGGQISGKIEMLTDATAASAAPARKPEKPEATPRSGAQAAAATAE